MRQLLSRLDKNRKFFQKIIVLPLLSAAVAMGLTIAPAIATEIYQVPQPNASEANWAIDLADTLSKANEGKLNSDLSKLAEATGKELRMVAIRHLDYGETIESFTSKLFATWFPTPEARANQILLAIDTETNNCAIVTGEEAKKLLTDDIAKSVAAETVELRLRAGNKYNQAFLDASDRLVAVLSGRPDPGPPALKNDIDIEGNFTKAEDTDKKGATVWVIGLLIAATVIPMATYFLYAGLSN